MKHTLAVLSVLALAACGGSQQALPTGAPAVDEREVRIEAYVAQWAAAKGLEPIPVSFVPNLQIAFALSASASGIVPCGERRIYFDQGMLKRPTYDWFPGWIAAHEVGHVYYREYESCTFNEPRADAFANELTGQDWWPHGEL